jgi:Domain of unknown function (DUF6438)/Ankyrin repeats (3 copies)/Ankyrin repeats (many copies)
VLLTTTVKYHRLLLLSAAAIGLVAILLTTVVFARRGLSPDIETAKCPSLSSLWKQPWGPIGTADVIELTRGQCLGSCPVYTVQVRGDGTVTWHGKMHVEVRGEAAGRIQASEARDLISSFRSNGFWDLCGSYNRRITDFAAVSTRLSIAGQTKSVLNYADAAPDWLSKLEQQIDSLADTHRWRHSEASLESVDLDFFRNDLIQPKHGVTPLMVAAGRGSPSSLVRLLHSGAAINDPDESGWTPLMYAAGLGNDENSEALVHMGAKVMWRSRFGQTPLHAAASSGDTKITRVLIGAGAQVDARDRTGNTPLMIAVQKNWNKENIAALLTAGSDSRLRNAQGQTTLDLLNATEQRDSKIVWVIGISDGPRHEGPDSYGVIKELLNSQTAK